MQRRTLINTKNLFTWKVFFGQAHFNDYLNDAVTHKDILGAKYLMNSINESLRFVDVDRPVFYEVGFFLISAQRVFFISNLGQLTLGPFHTKLNTFYGVMNLLKRNLVR